MNGLILLVFAFVLFVIGAWGPAIEPYWRRIVSAGLACWVAAELFGRIIK